MNDQFSTETLQALAQTRGRPQVSLYSPMQRAGVETRENPIRFKNLLVEAEEKLATTEMRSVQIRELLASARQFVDVHEYWQQQSDGLAVFLAPDTARLFRLPLEFQELVTVQDRFHFKPLLPLFSGDGQFYVLAISQNEIRLLQGTRHHVDELSLEHMPNSLAEALRFDDPESQLQFHTGSGMGSAPGAGPGRAAMFHGHGVGIDDDKNDILRYFQQIDQGLHQVLRDQQAPLVLAGVDYLLPIFREASSYAHLVEGGVMGNPEEWSAQELHSKAWAVVEPHFQTARKKAAEQFQQLHHTDQASADIRTIVPAASYGRVDILFVALGRHQWGRFDPDQNQVQMESESTPDNEDLLDLAAIKTITQGGTVYAVPPEQVPDGQPMAAVFRY